MCFEDLYQYIQQNNLSKLEQYYQEDPVAFRFFLNQFDPQSQHTLISLATDLAIHRDNQWHIVNFLLDKDADPCIHDGKALKYVLDFLKQKEISNHPLKSEIYQMVIKYIEKSNNNLTSSSMQAKLEEYASQHLDLLKKACQVGLERIKRVSGWLISFKALKDAIFENDIEQIKRHYSYAPMAFKFFFKENKEEPLFSLATDRAIKTDNWRVCDFLLDKCIDPSLGNHRHFSALHAIIMYFVFFQKENYKNGSQLKERVLRYIDISSNFNQEFLWKNKSKSFRVSAFHLAACSRSSSIVKRFIKYHVVSNRFIPEKLPLRGIGDILGTPLITALYHGHIKNAGLILKQKNSLRKEEVIQFFELLFHKKIKLNPTVIQEVVDKAYESRVNVHQLTVSPGEIPVAHVVASLGCLGALKTFIKHGYRLKLKENCGFNAFQAAVFSGALECAKYCYEEIYHDVPEEIKTPCQRIFKFLDNPGSVHAIKQAQNVSILYLALSSGHSNVIEMIKFLFEKSAPVLGNKAKFRLILQSDNAQPNVIEKNFQWDPFKDYREHQLKNVQSTWLLHSNGFEPSTIPKLECLAFDAYLKHAQQVSDKQNDNLQNVNDKLGQLHFT